MCLSFTLARAQTPIKSFDIVDRGQVSSSDISKYVDAISVANMESYRNKTKNDTIVFDTGVKVVLYSAQELYKKGYNINPSEYVDVRDPRYTTPTFHLVDTAGGIPQAPGQKPYLVALYKRIEK